MLKIIQSQVALFDEYYEYNNYQTKAISLPKSMTTNITHSTLLGSSVTSQNIQLRITLIVYGFEPLKWLAVN